MHDALIISLSCPDVSVPCLAATLGEAVWESYFVYSGLDPLQLA